MGSKVAIIYFSATGNTEAMAEAVAVGARNTGAEVLLAPVSDVDPIEIGNTCHHIILGCSAWGVEVIEEMEMKPFCEKLKPYLKGKEMGIFGSCGWSRGVRAHHHSAVADKIGAQKGRARSGRQYPRQ